MDRKPLRVLFFAESPVSFWRYTPLVAALTQRGHTIHLAFNSQEVEGPLLDELTGRDRRVTYDMAPMRSKLDGWRPIAVIVRSLADMAKYADSHFEGAHVLRQRMRRVVLKRLRELDTEPISRRVAHSIVRHLAQTWDEELGRRVVSTAASIERAIPPSRPVTRYIGGRAPDVVLVTPVVKGPAQTDFLKSARHLGIPAGACIRSWDNLTNKGLLHVVPERVFVWNEHQRKEAVELHRVPDERVVATGSQAFDDWFERGPGQPREDFVRNAGLDPDQPYLLYLGSTHHITQGHGGETVFVREWLSALRDSSDDLLGRVGVMIRPHPNTNAAREWEDIDLSPFGNAVVWPRGGQRPVDSQAKDAFFDSMFHSSAVVGINTTAMIEAAIVGRSVFTIIDPGFAQGETRHFRYLLSENGGFLHVATSLDENVRQLRDALTATGDGAARTRAFVEAFVRPHGLDTPATTVLADAVEELASVKVELPQRPRLAVAALLRIEAAVNVLAILVSTAIRGVRNRRH